MQFKAIFATLIATMALVQAQNLDDCVRYIKDSQQVEKLDPLRLVGLIFKGGTPCTACFGQNPPLACVPLTDPDKCLADIQYTCLGITDKAPPS